MESSIFNPLTLKLGPNGMSLFDSVKFFCTSTLSDKRNADLTGLSPSSWSVMARNLYPLGKRPMQSRSRFTYGGKDGAKKGRLRVTVRLS
jgi:hypothetical protein